MMLTKLLIVVICLLLENSSKLTENIADNRSHLTIMEQVRHLSLNKHVGTKINGIQFAYVPHDTLRPISEISLPSSVVQTLGPAGDIIPAYVKSYFADGKMIDEHLFQEQVGKQNLIAGGNDQPINVSSHAMMNATMAGSVETFPLVRPSSTNKHQVGAWILRTKN